MTQRIEISWAWVKELNFWVFCQKKKKKRLKELSFHQKYDTKNWTFFQYDSKIFSNMTRRIQPFCITWLKDLVFFTKKNSKNLTFYGSQTWTFFSKYFPEMTRRIDPFFTMTLKMEFFFEVRIRITELFFSIRITELIFFFFEYDFFSKLNFFFWIRLEELKFSNTTRIQLFFSDMTQRIEPFLFSNVTQWILCGKQEKVQCIASSKKKAQFFESNNKRFNSLSPNSKTKRSSILRVMWRKVQFWVKKVQFFDFFFNPNFNWVTFKKMGSIHWVVFKKKVSSILWVILKKKFNSLNHIFERSQFFELFSKKKKEDKFFESCQKKFIWKRGYILWDILRKKISIELFLNLAQRIELVFSM